MSNIVSVATLSELYDALEGVEGGETIALEGGEYGKLFLGASSGFDITFPSNVTITSATSDNPAVFSGLDVRNAANLTFDGVTFDYTFKASDNIYERPFSVTGSEDITIRNSTFDGDLAQGISSVDDGYGYAIALSFRDSAGITVENNEFFEFHRGLSMSQSSDVVVTGNDMHSLRMDGMNFAEIAGVRIENNYLHDFNGSLNSNDHSDMIQFWTNGTDSPSSDIIIRGNHLDIGSGTPTQSIFMRNDQVDQGYFGSEMFYQNLLIEDNVIVNGHAHGITVGESNGLTIRNNSVLHSDGYNPDGKDPFVEIPKINISAASTGVTVENNLTYAIEGHAGQDDWDLTNNIFVQDQEPHEAGYYGDVFLASSLEVLDGVHDMKVRPGGALDGQNVGAFNTQDSSTDSLQAQFHVQNDADSAAIRHFDASFTGDQPEGTIFLWDFGDGTTMEGATATHAFEHGGVYDVRLTVETPDGQINSRQLSVDVAGVQVLSYVAGESVLAHNAGVAAALSAGAVDGDNGISLGGTGVATHIDREHIEAVLNTQEFEIDLTLTAHTAHSVGEIMRLHSSFVVSATDAGEVYLLAFSEDGTRIRMTTEGANLQDTQPHDIKVSLKDGVLGLAVNGETLASTNIDGALQNLGRHDLVFGNPWGSTNFEGDVSSLSIKVNESQFSSIAPTVEIAPLVESASLDAQEMAPEAQDSPPREQNASITDSAEDLVAPISVPVFATGRDEDIVMPASDYGPQRKVIAPIEQVQATHAIDAPQTNLGTAGVTAQISRDDVSNILGQDAFGISMTLSANSPESAGEIVRIHQSFLMGVDDHGEIYFHAFNDAGERIRLTTDGANMTDMAAHDVNVSLANGVISVDVDGVVRASAEMSGVLADEGNHDMAFGNPWGKENFSGVLSSFDVIAPASAAASPFGATQENIDSLTITPDDMVEISMETTVNHTHNATHLVDTLPTTRIVSEADFLMTEIPEHDDSNWFPTTDGYFE